MQANPARNPILRLRRRFALLQNDSRQPELYNGMDEVLCVKCVVFRFGHNFFAHPIENLPEDFKTVHVCSSSELTELTGKNLQLLVPC